MEFHVKNGVLQKYIPEKQTEEIVIPEGVTEISRNVFIGNKTVQRVIFPESLKKIGDSAFSGCTALREAMLPDGLLSVGAAAFSGCTALRAIHLPDTLQEIGVNAFGGTAWLLQGEPLMIRGDILICYSGAEETVILPDGIRVIAPDAFKRQQRPRGKDVLRRVVIPEGVAEIGTEAFRESAALEEVILPQSLREIGKSAFLNCTHLKSVTLPDGITRIPENLFYGCQSLETVQIPDTVTEIGANAFYYCTALKEIRLPDALKTIGANAFAECTALSGFEIPAQTNEIGANAFQRTAWEKEYPDEFIIHGDLLLKYKGTAQSVTIPAQVRRIADRAFEGKKITSLQLSDGLAEIGAYAFCQCNCLTKIVIPAGVQKIGESAFSMCKSVETLEFAGDIPETCKDGFSPLDSLREVVLPDGVMAISKYDSTRNWGYYYCRIVGSLLEGDISKREINSITAQMILDFYELTHRPDTAKMIRRFADEIFVKLDKAGATEQIVYLLLHKELLSEKMLAKMLDYAISAAQKTGAAEHQMLVMRAKDAFFGAKKVRLKL